VEHHEPPPPPAPPHVARITNPDWLHKPNGDDFVSYYPARAMELGKEGKVTLNCTVSATGTLTDCSVDESPAGYGFGDATLRISKLFKMKPQTADGSAVEGGKFTTVVVWRLAD
jgi:protein TonB